jgi:hypothetical protein
VLSEVYWLRDAANKAKRRVKKLVGRPDPSPWILRPKAPPQSQAYVDCVIALDPGADNTVLIRMLHEAMSPYVVSLLIANQANLAPLTEQVRAGKVKPHVYLDLCSAKHAEFGALLKAATEAGVFAVNASPKSASAKKLLEEAGAPACKSAVDPAERRIRAYNVFGSRSLLWWTPASGKYETLTWADVRRDNLMPAAALMDRVTRISEMEFFSADIRVADPANFALIDLGNGQCELNGQPDEWVKWCCGKLAEFVWRKKSGIAEQAGHLIWLGGR